MKDQERKPVGYCRIVQSEYSNVYYIELLDSPEKINAEIEKQSLLEETEVKK